MGKGGNNVVVDQSNHEDNAIVVTPLPKQQLLCVFTVQMAEALNVDLLFPFLAFMVEDMGYTGEALGYHAGILAASFCGAQFCTSVLWGVISDRYGRKISTIVGTLGAGVGILIFGFAKTFPQAIVGRVVGGLLCGNIGVSKSFLTEITDDTNRSAAFYLLSLAWSLGSVFAPLLGGMLCNPAEKFPSIFSSSPDSLFVEYPYLLPCLFALASNITAALLSAVFMIETVGASKEEIQARIAGKSSQSVLHGSGEGGMDTEKGLQMVHVGSSSGAGGGEASPKNGDGPTFTGGYSRLPIDPADLEDGANDDSELDRQWDVDYSENSSYTGKIQATQHSPMLDTVFEDQPVEVMPPAGLDASSAAGVSTSLQQPQGRVRNRSRSSSSTMPYTAVADADVGSSVTPALPQGRVRNRSRSSSNTTSFVDLEQPLDPTGIAFRPRVGSAASQFEAYNDVYTPIATHTELSSVYLDDSGQAKISMVDLAADSRTVEEDESEEICCPAVFEFAAQVGRSLGCMSRTNAAAALDGSVHSSQQLLGDSPKVNKGSVLVQRVVVLATLNYGMICASSILIDETLPLFLKLDARQGGFGFNTAQIGMLLSTGAAGMMLLTVGCMPLTSGISNKHISLISLACSIPLQLAFPCIALLNNKVLVDVHSNMEHMWLLWPFLILVNVIKNYLNCLGYISANIMVNHSVTDEYLGAVNGLGQSLGALARCLGPAVGGLLWSIGTRYHFVWLNFIFVTLMYILNMYVSYLVPKSLDHKKQRRSGMLDRIIKQS